MARNGTGTYVLPAGNPVTAGTLISETWANTTLGDIATALTNSLSADGQTVVLADLAMGANKITGLADGTSATHAATIGQVQAGAHATLTSVGGTTTAYTATLALSAAAFTNGQVVVFVPNATNTGAVTLAINGGTARAVVRQDGAAVVSGELVIGNPTLLVWNTATTSWRVVSSITQVLSGIYLPTLTEATNGAVVSVNWAHYFRMGDLCLVSGRFQFDPSGGYPYVKMSLPIITGTFADETKLTGSGTAMKGTQDAWTPVSIQGMMDAATAILRWGAGDPATEDIVTYQFTYDITP